MPLILSNNSGADWLRQARINANSNSDLSTTNDSASKLMLGEAPQPAKLSVNNPDMPMT
ncbi:MAG: hypothetical protein AB1757_17210 [Acidobacteriota bacterium]